MTGFVSVCSSGLTVVNGNPTCTGTWSVVDYIPNVTPFSAADLAIMGIDAPTILYVYTWGMGAVLSIWALGFAVGAGLTLIRKI